MSKLKDLTGETFRLLTVKSRADNNKHGKSVWNVTCSCEDKTESKVVGSNLTSGHTQSCGCLQVKSVTKLNTTHGLSKKPEYKTWLKMKARCLNPNNDSYESYGGKGIEVCDRWLESFENFYLDMGEKPKGKYSIDRLFPEGHYEPSNCRWATTKQQARNKSTTVLIKWIGREQCLMDWAKELSPILGVSSRTICGRVKRGWPIDKAFTLGNIQALKMKDAG